MNSPTRAMSDRPEKNRPCPAFRSGTAEHQRFLSFVGQNEAENFRNLGRRLVGSPPATGGH